MVKKLEKNLFEIRTTSSDGIQRMIYFKKVSFE
ncbi:hypothetical protein [Companilactobacillus hulinensis]